MIICVCRRISEREIAKCAHAGMDFDEIQFQLSVSMQCGKCEHQARAIVQQCRSPSELSDRAGFGCGDCSCGGELELLPQA